MEESSSPEGMEPASLASTAKTILDLDAVVEAMLTALPDAKPWQRQLRGHLAAVDGRLQILRLSISLERGKEEIAQAAADLVQPLRAAHVYVGAGRADMGTKTAVQIAFGLAQRLAAILAA